MNKTYESTSWNVVVRDASGGVRAEFAIFANTPAEALKAVAPNLTGKLYRNIAWNINVKRMREQV